MSSSAHATIFYGAVVPNEIVEKIRKARLDDPTIDQNNDEGFFTFAKQSGYTVVSHGQADRDPRHGLAIVEHAVYDWADGPLHVPSHKLALPSIEKTKELRAFLQSIECFNAPIGWYVAAYNG